MPLYTHDCSLCRYLGSTPNPRNLREMLDHYECGGSLIARWSSQPSANHSMPRTIMEQIRTTCPGETSPLHVTLMLCEALPES